MKDETLRSALQDWEKLSATQEQYLAYEARAKRIIDEEAAQREAELRVREAEEKVAEAEQKAAEAAEEAAAEAEQKIKEAREKTKEAEEKTREAEEKAEIKAREAEQNAKESIETIAHQLLAKGSDIEFVAGTTGINKERVLDIKREMQLP